MKLDKAQDIVRITLDDRMQVNNFHYLGVRIRNNGDNSQEVRKRMAMGLRTLNQLRNLWKDTDIATRMRVLRTSLPSCQLWL